MPKKITSFSLDEETLRLLRELAKLQVRSQASTITFLIKEAAAKAKIKGG